MIIKKGENLNIAGGSICCNLDWESFSYFCHLISAQKRLWNGFFDIPDEYFGRFSRIEDVLEGPDNILALDGFLDNPIKTKMYSSVEAIRICDEHARNTNANSIQTRIIRGQGIFLLIILGFIKAMPAFKQLPFEDKKKMVYNKIMQIQMSRKRRYLMEISNHLDEQSAQEDDELSEYNDNCFGSESEEELVQFDIGLTQKGGKCLWSDEGFRYTHKEGSIWRCTNRKCFARIRIRRKAKKKCLATFSEKCTTTSQSRRKNREITRQLIKEKVRAKPNLKPSELIPEVRQPQMLTEEEFMALGTDHSLKCLIDREKAEFLGNVNCNDPLAFTIPQALVMKNEESILLYDSRNIRVNEKNVVLIFGSKKLLQILAKADVWHIDSTFKAAPGLWSECFVIGASINNRMIVCIHALLPGKDSKYVEEALKIVKQAIHPATPKKVILDFEKAEIRAITKIFPSTNANGCMFHYGQSLFRNFKRLGLVQLYGEKSARGEAVRKCFRSILALPLLPEDKVRRAFSLIAEEAPPGLEHFLFYFARVYVGLTQREKEQGAAAFEPGTPIQSFNDSTIPLDSSGASDHSSYCRPIQFGIPSLAPSTPSMPTTLNSMSQSQTSGTAKWEEAIVQRPQYSIAFWNMHSQAAAALARTNNGLESTHLHFMRSLHHHPSLSDFIMAVYLDIDKQLVAALSARLFKHKRHKRYVIQDAVIMRILLEAAYIEDDDIRDLIINLALQVQGYAGQLREIVDAEDESEIISP